MLRHMLYDNQQDLMALQDELQFLDSYVSLMKIRLPENVEVTFTKDVQKPELRIRPFLFISLVENAFKHGISLTEPSFVKIAFKTGAEPVGDSGTRDTITCQISNSNYPKTPEDRSGHGIGLKQMQRRLDLAYPNRYEWTKGVNDDGKVYQSSLKIRL